MSSARVVALGGGHGLAATLTSLRAITDQITAIVTVADNGGSSGRLRQEFPTTQATRISTGSTLK